MGKKNRLDESYAKVMKEKKELTIEMVTHFFSAIEFILETGRLGEFMGWHADRALKNLTKKGGDKR